ncbi:MAG: double-strand break repair helicase AddA [Zymomonas mobilis subsp. pomaceae]|uniref:double-strand break repair helicase AddA n=1 Tax=Zymomonas mobilis TaxID=542 RepID=UPI0039EBED25
MVQLTNLQPLKEEQRQASDPISNIWLSASAGTGKTHVLTARVLRLLLNKAAPESILCLTFTKAGAAEMAERIHQRLASWVQLEDERLREELIAIGERYDHKALAFARTLFARVLDAPGGLRIQTIHSFCQSLLTAFPVEAGLTPGFRLIEGREEVSLAKRTLAELLEQASQDNAHRLLDNINQLSDRLGEQGVQDYLYECRFYNHGFIALGQGIEAKVRQALNLPLSDITMILSEACDDNHFDFALLRNMAAANEKWGTDTAKKNLAWIDLFVKASPQQRIDYLSDLKNIVLKADGDLRAPPKGIMKLTPEYASWMQLLAEQIHRIVALQKCYDFSVFVTAALKAGQSYCEAWHKAKQKSGLVDFKDMIDASVLLLRTPGIGEWVRYKLDRITDHILVDEAQDTNILQWAIITALTEDFFSGDSAKSSYTRRSIFTVGDFKQAIYGFQGTNPQAFLDARDYFIDKAKDSGRDILDLSLNRSFRSTPPILTIVDYLLKDIQTTEDGIGIEAAMLKPHYSARSGLGGSVRLWQPTCDYKEEGEETESTVDEDESQLENSELEFAIKLARQIKAWLDPKTPFYLEGLGRNLEPQDILILVRNRGKLASLIVGCLHTEKIPVAGLDRLSLTTPLAVCDLLSAIRFVLQPDDDLTLACLLVSPLIGWDQDRLYRLAVNRAPRETLFDRLRKSEQEQETWDIVRDWLEKADFITPYRFLEMLLSGPLKGRQKLFERLGEEARDPINELLNSALLLESETIPSFQRFLDWFDSGDVEIKRDPSTQQNTVRIMTVHGAKGLQAPLVILADATRDPHQSNGFQINTMQWDLLKNNLPVIIPQPNKNELEYLPIKANVVQIEKEALQEHWRLLYVAATRAEECLVITGNLGKRSKAIPPIDSWYACSVRAMNYAAQAMKGQEMTVWQEDVLWGKKAVYHQPTVEPPVTASLVKTISPKWDLPLWLDKAVISEPRPSYPLTPSSLGNDDIANPPPDASSLDAARRGSLLHALFERLPMLPVEDREKAGLNWLEYVAAIKDPAQRQALISDACRIMDDPQFAIIFSDKALAEAPIAAQVGVHVISGTVDRLWSDEKHVWVIDFKTGRRVPSSADRVILPHLKQMAAYVAALEKIFPDHIIHSALLYTTGPKLISFERDFLRPYFDAEL